MLIGRQKKILSKILVNYAGINGDILAEENMVSKRTVRNDIISINKVLCINGCCIKSNNKGYYIESKDLANVEKVPGFVEVDKIPSEPDQRISYLLGKLIDRRKIKINDITKETFLSRQTVNLDGKKLRSLVLDISGQDLVKINSNEIYIEIKERDIRVLLYEVIKNEILLNSDIANNNLYNLMNYKFNEQIFEHIKYSIRKFYSEKDNQLIHYSYSVMTWLVYFTIIRNIKGYTLHENDYNREVIKFQKLNSNMRFKLSNEDLLLLQEYLNSIEIVNWSGKKVSCNNSCKRICEEFCDSLQSRFDIDLRVDEEILESLCNHIKYMIKRLEVDYQKVNPALYEIKKNYSFAYEVALSMGPIIKKYKNKYLMEDEVGFIAMYIEYFFQKYEYKVRAVLASNNDFAITNILKKCIEDRFKDSITVVDNIPIYYVSEYIESNDVDLIISTQFCEKTGNVPVCYINYLPFNNDLAELGRIIDVIKSRDKKTRR
ncbi:MAG: BglG family transcription antiterminator [Clostridium paraputrificum]